jgi:aspartyl-tRNA(Asn)/glutamyl-tRNA(Gln) amidotransferase subunit C
MDVNNELIDYLATLARLKIQPADKPQLREDMQKMIGFIEKLQDLNTEGVTPLLHMTEAIDRLRKDEVKNLMERSSALNEATKKDNQFFLVPKVIKK